MIKAPFHKEDERNQLENTEKWIKIVAEFEEFEDRGFCICHQLEEYFNECPEHEGYNYFLLALLIFFVGIVAFALYNFILTIYLIVVSEFYINVSDKMCEMLISTSENSDAIQN